MSKVILKILEKKFEEEENEESQNLYTRTGTNTTIDGDLIIRGNLVVENSDRELLFSVSNNPNVGIRGTASSQLHIQGDIGIIEEIQTALQGYSGIQGTTGLQGIEVIQFQEATGFVGQTSQSTYG